MAGWTNKGKWRMLGWVFRADTLPTNFFVGLVTSAVAPTADINTFGQLTEIAIGNGYDTAGGYSLNRNSTDFDAHSEDDAADRGRMQIKDVVWNASGGPIPASGGGARYAVLLDDNGTAANREVICYFDLTSDRTVSDGQPLTLQDSELRLNET